MGMYTEVYFRAEMRAEVAQLLSDIRSKRHRPRDLPAHPFFQTERFELLPGVGDSAHFPGHAWFRMIPCIGDPYARHSPDPDDWAIVEFRSSFKNYDDEAALFFDWVTAHIRDGGGGGGRDFIGYSLYEEGDPVLYYKGGEDGDRS